MTDAKLATAPAALPDRCALAPLHALLDAAYPENLQLIAEWLFVQAAEDEEPAPTPQRLAQLALLALRQTERIAAAAAARGYEVQVDSAGKATLRAAGEGAKAVDGLADAHKRAGDAAVSAADRAVTALEKQNAGIERLNAANEKAADLERKRMGVDKDGFSTGKDGQRFVAGSEIGTLTGVAAFLKAAGIDDDKVARSIAREFADAQGNIMYMDNPGQKKYGGDTMSMALLKAAERYTFGTGGGTPQTPASIPAQQPATTTVNISLGGSTRSINTDAAGAATLQEVLRELADARGTAGAR